MTVITSLPLLSGVLQVVDVSAKFSGGAARPQSPPMGWRSWNVFQCDVSQEIIQRQMDALAAKRIHDGVPTSLLDLGYNDIGLDDCWQVCDAKGESFHDPDSGMAIINTELFPDMEGMVNYGHARGMQLGFYLNNCVCNERGQPTHYAEDVNLTFVLGYDSVKIDSCGNQRDMTEWVREFEASGRTPMLSRVVMARRDLSRSMIRLRHLLGWR
jgi:alpha-galactosidase